MANKGIYFGSHNTMTYLPIKNWWLFPGLLIARCQNKDYKIQFEQGCRVFDLRIYWDNDKYNWGFAHGLINFKVKDDVYEVIRWLAEMAQIKREAVYVRIILEKWSRVVDAVKFKEFCHFTEDYLEDYDFIKFIGGNSKEDWVKLYTFDDDIPDKYVHQYVSSMANDVRWYERIFPFLYAKRCNEKNKTKQLPIINLFDFV